MYYLKNIQDAKHCSFLEHAHA